MIITCRSTITRLVWQVVQQRSTVLKSKYVTTSPCEHATPQQDKLLNPSKWKWTLHQHCKQQTEFDKWKGATQSSSFFQNSQVPSSNYVLQNTFPFTFLSFYICKFNIIMIITSIITTIIIIPRNATITTTHSKKKIIPLCTPSCTSIFNVSKMFTSSPFIPSDQGTKTWQNFQALPEQISSWATVWMLRKKVINPTVSSSLSNISSSLWKQNKTCLHICAHNYKRICNKTLWDVDDGAQIDKRSRMIQICPCWWKNQELQGPNEDGETQCARKTNLTIH